MQKQPDPIQLIETLLVGVKQGQPDTQLVLHLARLSYPDFAAALADEVVRKTFWINAYNAFSLLLLQPNGDVLLSPIKRFQHFRKSRITIAGHALSLNDLEHGILRHSKLWWAKGYINNPAPSAFEKAMRVPLDPRIHFALNCGGNSCPPIRYYEADKLEAQLNLAIEAFLETETSYEPSTDTLTINAILSWYEQDFGGRTGLLQFLTRFGVLPADASPKLVVKDYDWEPNLTAFA